MNTSAHPAFPVAEGENLTEAAGLTQRAYVATAIMAAMVGNSSRPFGTTFHQNHDEYADVAVMLADALLRRLEQDS